MLTWTQTLRCVLLSLPTVQIEKYVVDYWKRQAEGDRNGLQEPSLQKCMGMMGDFMKEVDPAFDMVWKMYVKSRPSPPKDEGMRKENDSDEPFYVHRWRAVAFVQRPQAGSRREGARRVANCPHNIHKLSVTEFTATAWPKEMIRGPCRHMQRRRELTVLSKAYQTTHEFHYHANTLRFSDDLGSVVLKRLWGCTRRLLVQCTPAQSSALLCFNDENKLQASRLQDKLGLPDGIFGALLESLLAPPLPTGCAEGAGLPSDSAAPAVSLRSHSRNRHGGPPSAQSHGIVSKIPAGALQPTDVLSVSRGFHLTKLVEKAHTVVLAKPKVRRAYTGRRGEGAGGECLF